MSNELIFDNAGKPSIMVRIPKFKVSDVISGGREVTHSAFIIDGAEVPEIYIPKYQNIIVDERAYSLPFQKPAVNLTFDEAREACENKGRGWHLMTNAEFAAVLLWAKKNGTLPHGNNNWGSYDTHEDEKGICFDGFKVLTGSGPNTWAHDHTQEGIFDLNGNAWEWCSGLQLVNGEIQIIPDNNAAKHIDQSPASSEWQTITVDGKTLKYAETEDGLKLTTEKQEGNWGVCRFTDLETDIKVPDILKELALYPVDDAKLTDVLWARLKGQRAALRGGCYANASNARSGFALHLYYLPSGVDDSVAFRAAFVNL